MSLSNRRRGRVSPPPAKYDPEWENQLRRAFEESILKPDDFTNSYPFNSPYLSGGRIEVTQISNVTGGWSNVTGEYTKTSPHDEESETDGSHHWVMRQWRPPSYCGTAYYASPSRLPESVSVYPNVSGFRLDYDNLAPWSSYDAIADALASTDTKICFQALVGYSAQATLMGGAVSRVDDEMLAETKSYWQMSLADLRDGVASHALSIANYQYVSNNASGSLLPDQGILDVTSPLEAVDNPGAYCTTIRINATAADKYLYSTGVDTWAEGAITTFGRSLLDDADATAGRNTLGASTGVWPATLGGTGQSTTTTGDLLVGGAANTWSKLAAGTSGYVLTSGGAGVAPSWAAAAGGAIDGSGAATRVAYWSDADTLTSDADLTFDGTNLLVKGIGVAGATPPGTNWGSSFYNMQRGIDLPGYFTPIVWQKQSARSWGIFVNSSEVMRFATTDSNDASGSIFQDSFNLAYGNWTTAGWLRGVQMPSYNAIVWNTPSPYAGILGYQGKIIFLSSTALDASAAPSYYGHWGPSGLMVGASYSVTPARALEVRSTSAQIRISPDTTAFWDAFCATDGSNKWTTGTGLGSTELEATRTITGAVTDGYAGSLILDPGYTAATAQTVTRHNYLDAQDVSVAGAGPAAVTDACLVRFDAAAGTHKATVGATTKTTPGGVDAWIKININGTLYYVPAYTSTTA